MSNMISVASGFQYSVNIGYDLNNDDKLKNFIPTQSALTLMEDILLSTRVTSIERARVLIGAYGKGKSHIILMILSMLMKRDLSLFEKLLPKLEENERLYQCVQSYYESDQKILPVIINGSNTSLPQAFLLALQRTLAENDLMDIMPETNYKAAVAVIQRWKTEFPDTYMQLQKAIDEPVGKFVEDLEDYSITAYEKFERIYPTLTAGSVFSPFLGFNVVDLYESAVRGLRSRGYTGIYVVYDEFSKFLEANISEASVSDTKMLQDFAEKCNRSGEYQIHLMLISHKEIANYIDMLSKQKVDGWRGVSERFKHIHLNNNFAQTYEIIASVIQKDASMWTAFNRQHKDAFDGVKHRYINHAIFTDGTKKDLERVIYTCYPLHPVSTFMLPRLSERVAQNERTLFTFLSAAGTSTLPEFLAHYDDHSFDVITPDNIYDYFEPLFRKEIYTGEIHQMYLLTTAILPKLQPDSLESKIVKTLSLIYILEQFEKLKPTKDEIVGIFSVNYSVGEIETAIANLIEKEYVVYLKRSNDYLRLKQTSGIDIGQKIRDTVASLPGKVSTKATLNALNFDNYVYPSRYNDQKEMTRYFSFEFIEENEVQPDTDWTIKSEAYDADGVVYGIIPESDECIGRLHDTIVHSSVSHMRCIFILPKKYTRIDNLIQEFNALALLKEQAAGDKVLFDEYEVVYEDLQEVISDYISTYTRPESYKSTYVYMGAEQTIIRKAALTGLVSDICDRVYSRTPVINNEAINRNELTSIANNSRNKIVAGLLRNELEQNLGLAGSGQEVSIMRSTLLRTGVLVTENSLTRINLYPEDELIRNMLTTVIGFIQDTKIQGRLSFSELYHRLISPENNIGLRKGLIPIYLAAVFHEFKQELILEDKFGQVPLTADVLLQINADPNSFSLAYLDWSPEKAEFIHHLAEIFSDYVIEAERMANSYDYVVSAMKRWYMALPKYAKELKRTVKDRKVDKRYTAMIRLLKQSAGGHELLFEKFPSAFEYTGQFSVGLAENIAAAKKYYDNCITQLKKELIQATKELFSISKNTANLKSVSLTSVLKDWCERLDKSVFEQLFADGTEKCLGLFKTATNDEDTLIVRLAKTVTDLRLEDWDNSTYDHFVTNLKKCKATAEGYRSADSMAEVTTADAYQVTFVDTQGISVTKRFSRVDYSKRGQLLYNQVVDALASMGQSISEQEKRQIIIDILKELC
ncbi:MAG: restriction endonuclease subunit S [Ruminococcus flavefaciens]|nr:restriction endonuclease subunit S [Ruminococcus flavefaciens]